MNLGISATEFVSQVRGGNISVEEFVSKTIERIQKVENKVHAYITLNDKNALEKARIIDKKIENATEEVRLRS